MRSIILGIDQTSLVSAGLRGMETDGLSVVIGAFGYTGRYIAQRLLSMGMPVKTLTGHMDRPNPFGARVAVAPLDFDNPAGLARSLEGADVLYNTYWIRFSRGPVTFDKAVQNTRTLIKVAEDAGIRRIVHVSITNAFRNSPLPYFRGKGLLEEAIRNSTLSYAIIRPAVIFGKEDILVNNIAWFLRRFPVFTVFGSGEYGIQPVFVEDMAEIAVSAANESENVVKDAVGPQTFTYEEMVRLIAEKIGSKARLVHVRPGVGLFLSRLMGLLVRDVVITRDEVAGLTANLLVSQNPPTGHTRLSNWLEQNAATVGTSYASELRRHYR